MDEQKISDIIEKLFINSTDNYIFIYTPPKVGSTTLVTSLRVSLGKTYNIIHIHDEIMLSVLTGIKDVKINDIIYSLTNKGKTVFVIDVYRTPIERKMSEYFEKLSPYHFNNTEENMNYYSIKRITDRFNKLFPHIENGEHYFDKYNISDPIPFDFEKKYTLEIINNINYIKLRLSDSNLWCHILSNIFKTEIVIINDYKTEDKGLGDLYKKFKNEYRIPQNFIEIIKNDKYFNFYYNEIERNKYLEGWTNKLANYVIPYTEEEYKFYMNLCLENQYINDIQINHYIDNGCFCRFCSEKRRNIFFKAKAGENKFEKIIHNQVINEKNNGKIKFISNKLREIVKKHNSNFKYKTHQFTINVSNR
jgi:hypothetical protein